MSINVTGEELQKRLTSLPPAEQLKLMAHLCEQLNSSLFSKKSEVTNEWAQKREIGADELLALCDAAAEMWEGEFDVAEEIRQMRQERDEQTWPSRS